MFGKRLFTRIIGCKCAGKKAFELFFSLESKTLFSYNCILLIFHRKKQGEKSALPAWFVELALEYIELEKGIVCNLLSACLCALKAFPEEARALELWPDDCNVFWESDVYFLKA